MTAGCGYFGLHIRIAALKPVGSAPLPVGLLLPGLMCCIVACVASGKTVGAKCVWPGRQRDEPLTPGNAEVLARAWLGRCQTFARPLSGLCRAGGAPANSETSFGCPSIVGHGAALTRGADRFAETRFRGRTALKRQCKGGRFRFASRASRAWRGGFAALDPNRNNKGQTDGVKTLRAGTPAPRVSAAPPPTGEDQS